MRWARAAIALLLLGGTLGVALDAMHVASGTTRYAETWAFGIAWWTVPLFASAAVVLGLGPTIVERVIGRAPAAPRRLLVFAAMSLFVLAYLTSCVVHGPLGAIVLAAVAGLTWWIVDRRPLGIAHAVTAAVGGFAFEAMLVHGGLFEHTDPALLGIPIWLPCLYLCASLAVSSLARMLIAEREASPNPDHWLG